MKRIYLLFLILFAVESFGQVVTQFPIIDEQSSNETEITKVELRGEYTIIHFRYQMSKRRGRNYDFSSPNQKQYTTISFNPDGYLNGNGKRFRYIKSTGIVELTDEKSKQKVYPGDVHLFTVYFERLDPGVELFNLIEGKNNPEQNLLFWNFYGIHIKNPLRNSSSMPNAAIILTIKGRLMDAKMQKAIGGKVVYKIDKDTKNAGYKIVQPNGSFSFALKPDAYTFTATATGYEKAETSIDLSKLKKAQQFTQDIYLAPITRKLQIKAETKPLPPKTVKPAEPPVISAPKIEVPGEESAPVRVEENKFRLDKVYFNIGESGILERSYEQLDGLLKIMKDSPTMTIVIEGHTDNVGDADENKRLSLRRAFNVREYLIKRGIVGKRVQFKGFGDTKPIANNNTEEGRKQNRRVEFVIVNP